MKQARSQGIKASLMKGGWYQLGVVWPKPRKGHKN